MTQVKLNNYKDLKKAGAVYIECGRTRLENKGYGQNFNLDKTRKSILQNIYRHRFGNSAYIKSVLKNYKKYDYANALFEANNRERKIAETGAVKLEVAEFKEWQNENGIVFKDEKALKDAYYRFVWSYYDTRLPKAIWEY